MSRPTREPTPDLLRRWIESHRRAVGRHLQRGLIMSDGRVGYELERPVGDGRWLARQVWPTMTTDEYRVEFDPTTPAWSRLPESARTALFVAGAFRAQRDGGQPGPIPERARC